jgi:hypothetical protein
MNTFYEHHHDGIRFGYRCFDRILINGLIQPFQQPERVVGFFNTYREQYPVSKAFIDRQWLVCVGHRAERDRLVRIECYAKRSHHCGRHHNAPGADPAQHVVARQVAEVQIEQQGVRFCATREIHGVSSMPQRGVAYLSRSEVIVDDEQSQHRAHSRARASSYTLPQPSRTARMIGEHLARTTASGQANDRPAAPEREKRDATAQSRFLGGTWSGGPCYRR